MTVIRLRIAAADCYFGNTLVEEMAQDEDNTMSYGPFTSKLSTTTKGNGLITLDLPHFGFARRCAAVLT